MRWAVTVVALACAISFFASSRSKEKVEQRVPVSSGASRFPRALPRSRPTNPAARPMSHQSGERQESEAQTYPAARASLVEEYAMVRQGQKPLDHFWEISSRAREFAQTEDEKEDLLEIEILAVNSVIQDAEDLLEFIERVQLTYPEAKAPLYYRAVVLNSLDRREEAETALQEYREKLTRG